MEVTKASDRESYVCPFLIEDSCSVYKYRPLVCRAFGVLTEDSNGNPAYPFCTTLGLNFGAIYDEEKQHLSSDLVAQNGYKIFPKIFRLSNKVIMNLPLAKQLNIEFGEAKKMVDFL
jgi:Fe-S-cluster containining protein